MHQVVIRSCINAPTTLLPLFLLPPVAHRSQLSTQVVALEWRGRLQVQDRIQSWLPASRMAGAFPPEQPAYCSYAITPTLLAAL